MNHNFSIICLLSDPLEKLKYLYLLFSAQNYVEPIVNIYNVKPINFKQLRWENIP